MLDLGIACQRASGRRAACTRGDGPSRWDAAVTAAAAAGAAALLPRLLAEAGGDSVVLSTWGALAGLLLYDTAPSAMGLALIGWWFVRLYRRDAHARKPVPVPG